jgi:hypothetical protein
MSDMNSLTVILLAEACAILLIALIAVLWFQFRSKSKLRKAVQQLVSQIKTQSKTRTEETGSFLQEFYGQSDEELAVAIADIGKQERRFFQNMVDVLILSDPNKIISLDASVAELIDTYKNLKPKHVEATTESGAVDLATLRAENETLTVELEITRETMSSMISEFGAMFGGGGDNDTKYFNNPSAVRDAVGTQSGKDINKIKK